MLSLMVANWGERSILCGKEVEIMAGPCFSRRDLRDANSRPDEFAARTDVSNPHISGNPHIIRNFEKNSKTFRKAEVKVPRFASNSVGSFNLLLFAQTLYIA